MADVQTRLSSYLEAVNGTGQAVVQLADALAKLFAETPLAEVATRYRERADLLGDVASRTTSQLSQDVSSVLHKYTHLIPGTKSAVEAHQRSWNHFDKTRETLDHMRPGEGERVRRRAETRLEEAATAFAQNDARLAKAVQEIGEQKVQVKVGLFLSQKTGRLTFAWGFQRGLQPFSQETGYFIYFVAL